VQPDQGNGNVRVDSFVEKMLIAVVQHKQNTNQRKPPRKDLLFRVIQSFHKAKTKTTAKSTKHKHKDDDKNKHKQGKRHAK
jgi:hypothetical protein